jgi:hypothetical protein
LEIKTMNGLPTVPTVRDTVYADLQAGRSTKPLDLSRIRRMPKAKRRHRNLRLKFLLECARARRIMEAAAVALIVVGCSVDAKASDLCLGTPGNGHGPIWLVPDGADCGFIVASADPQTGTFSDPTTGDTSGDDPMGQPVAGDPGEEGK